MFATWSFVAALFIQTVGALVHISKEGVTSKFVIEFENKCKSGEGQFTSLLGVSVGQCAEECGLRKHCVALNYIRRSNVCELLSSVGDDVSQTTGCIHIRASDIKVIQEPCGDCTNGTVCDTATKKCIIKECATTPALENGRILGNVNKVGGRIQFKCNKGYREKNGIKTSICLDTGQWSETAECVPDSICHTGWKHFKGSCYLFANACGGWEDSKVFCESKSAHLVKVEDSEEDEFIRGIISVQQYEIYYWIGGRFDTEYNEFRWTDGSPVTFNGWRNDETVSKAGCVDYLKLTKPPWKWNAHSSCVSPAGQCICEIAID